MLTHSQVAVQRSFRVFDAATPDGTYPYQPTISPAPPPANEVQEPGPCLDCQVRATDRQRLLPNHSNRAF